LLTSAVCAQGASAATLVGDYQFQGTLNSSGGVGAPLTSIGPGAGSFLTAPVLGSTRSVYAFPQHNGLRIAPAGIPTSDTPYSIVTTFELDQVSGYRRILDQFDNTDERGLYVHNGKLDFYLGVGAEQESAAVLVGAGSFFTLTATIDASGPGVGSGSQFYFNGTRVIASSIAFGLSANALRLFKDAAVPTTDEDSAGRVSCVRVFSGVLTDAEVAAIGASASCGGPPPITATSAKHKCKKKRKHHRASAAKKKKCKKKRKK
jgi:hypothetical protein